MLHLLFLSLAELGQKRANPEACPTNMARMGACQPCDNLSTCEDVITVSNIQPTDNLESLVFDGVSYTPTNPIPANDTEAIESWLSDVVLPSKEFNLWCSVSYENNTLVIRHIGQCAITDVTVSGSGTVEVLRNCDLRVICNYTCSSVDTIPDLGYDGNTETLANNPYPWTGTQATDDATAAQLQTDVTTALDNLSVPYVSVNVSVDNDDESYQILIEAEQGLSLYLGSTLFNADSCQERFLAEGAISNATSRLASNAKTEETKGEEREAVKK